MNKQYFNLYNICKSAKKFWFYIYLFIDILIFVNMKKGIKVN